VNKLIQLLLIFAILITALFGLGFGLCGVWGLSVALTEGRDWSCCSRQPELPLPSWPER